MTTPTTTSLPSTTTSTATPYCTTAVPGKYGYVPPDACNSNYSYSPSFGAAITFSVLFGFVTIAQITQAISYRKGFCWVMIMACTWEFISFVTRAIGSHDQQKLSYAFASQILFLLAPLWLNAYAYMTAGRMIYTFHPAKKVYGIKAISIGKYFVWLDIFSFLVQGTGGSMLSPGSSADSMKIGKNVYMTGVGIQELFIVLFTGLIVRFHIEYSRMLKSGTAQSPGNQRWKWLTYALYACLVLITVRIIFRLVEFSAGVEISNPLPYHEIYALILDAFPMVLAMTILTVIHPGMVLKGPESEFPSRKERRAEKKAKKAEKKAQKEEKKMAKKGLGQNTKYDRTQTSNDHLVTEDVELGNTAGHNNRYYPGGN
ncbi:RTA1 like protein-domain-containing protein [Clohesyomyces aquaticus]|uniref:RTA1 like protein-domain-containing protein n=1 Tax=Clohesyomyces aquaticus TaxID=1231657 RepID=A0A1Y1ZS17_9PLEO|nr:RTA1 like protein-domain-containing protein [Clohesyomyces aquaticus]